MSGYNLPDDVTPEDIDRHFGRDPIEDYDCECCGYPTVADIVEYVRRPRVTTLVVRCRECGTEFDESTFQEPDQWGER